jgi:hypothetical protein
MSRRFVATALAAVALLAVATAGRSYSTYAKWKTSPVTFYVNPANADVTASAATSAVQFAMNVWNTQSGTPFRYQYGGAASDTATAYDNRNVLIFRNASSGSAIATTYSWWDSNKNLLDTDVIMWSGSFNFFTGSIGCGIVSNAAYIEDIATHELGHALGLNHSTSSSATMYPSYSYCSQAFRTLASDDIAGAKALYGTATAPPPANTPPTVVITSPANSATFTVGSTISLAATATDAEDGNLSSRVQWTDNSVSLGSGGLLSSLLSVVGVHTFVAKVTDNAGATASSQVSITVTVLPPTSATLTAKTSVLADGTQKVGLYWTGLPGSVAAVFRNNTKIDTTANDGSKGYNMPTKTTATYSFFVCSNGTTTCTNTVKVVF